MVAHPLENRENESPHGRRLDGMARLSVICAELDRKVKPLILESLLEDDEAVWLEGIVPGRQRSAYWPSQLVVAAANEPERVVVEAEPDMQPVFLDPSA